MYQFQESNIYKIWFSPLIYVLFSALGATVGIWLGYLIVEYLFKGLWVDLAWPGVEKLVQDGVFLLISFSFLANVLYESTRRAKITALNVFTALLLIIVTGYYARVIAIEAANIEHDKSLSLFSFLTFYGSIFLLYATLVREKFVAHHTSPRQSRSEDFNELSEQVDE